MLIDALLYVLFLLAPLGVLCYILGYAALGLEIGRAVRGLAAHGASAPSALAKPDPEGERIERLMREIDRDHRKTRKLLREIESR